ncbi:MAG: type II toxin-antitoxin system VapC family toxin [Solirubrobacterales bacterium]
MTLILDAAPLVALADQAEPLREEILRALESERGSLYIAAPVTAEIDYLLANRFGPAARRAFLEDLAERRYEAPALDASDYSAALELDRRYADLDVGLADLATVVLAAKLGTRRILTFDERHFRAIRPIQGGSFELWPADAPGT